MHSIQLTISFILVSLCSSSVIRVENEEVRGLYSDDDKVMVLNAVNFTQNVFDRPYAVEVEFYNSFCGFCRRFAPIWIEYAKSIQQWRNVVRIAAVNCAADENSDLCRNYEIMAYPTLRYFPPFYKNLSTNLGINIVHKPLEVGHESLIQLMSNETTPPESWPELKAITFDSIGELFESMPNGVQYMFLVYDTNVDSIVAQDAAIDLQTLKSQIQIRHVASITIAVKLGLNHQASLYVADKSSQKIERIPLTELNRLKATETIVNFLQQKGIELPSAEAEQLQEPNNEAFPSSTTRRIDPKMHALIEHVKLNPGVVYQADIETALRYSVFHELVKFNEMSSEQMDAARRYVSVLQKYSPLGENGQKFLTALSRFVSSKNSFTGRELSAQIKLLEANYDAIFSSKHYIGCLGSSEGKRGYTCGLWTMFHYLTVQAARDDRQTDPLEVLRALHGFVKHFFGCSHCSEHFQEMAERRDIWSVSSKDDAILWLWSAHNEVNKRLAGDNTEDPEFPKKQFPTTDLCAECHRVGSDENDTDTQWNRHDVLHFLKRMNSPLNTSRFGVENENALSESLDHRNITQQLGSTSAFSEWDIRMGLITYACCILIIIVAIKLFMHRGYRKKIYVHDSLGKV